MLEVLNRQHEMKYDVVVPSTHLHYESGDLMVREGATRISGEGVDLVTARLSPNRQFEDQLAERLEIPVRYLRKMREHGTEASMFLLDQNVNHWFAEAERNFFIRGFRGTDPDDLGIARAIMSDRYQVIDHLDALFAVLDGVKDGGVPVNVTSADLSETKMRVKIEAPEVTASAARFLERYRPDLTPGQITHGFLGNPNLISAGLVITNSETGGAAFQIAPQVTVLVCRNGMTRTVDAMRRVHLGTKMDQGVINWSVDTKRKELELIRSQARDAVRTFISHEYIERVASVLNQQGETLLRHPLEVVDELGKRLRYSETERQAILDLFVNSGDSRASGVVQAFTAFARDLDDPDRAAEIEEESFTILEMAATG
jgi:hypothetical protein